MSPEEGGPAKGCPFMRENLAGDGFACAIYATRPQICREFRCYRMLIHHPDGHECGRIMGRNQLKTTDETLERIWEEQVAPLPYRDDAAWIRSVTAILTSHGYRGDPVE